MMPPNPANYVLGTLCTHGHDHEGTGKSLRYKKGGYCVKCTRDRDAARKPLKAKPTASPATKRAATQIAVAKPAPAPAPAPAPQPQRDLVDTGDVVLELLAERCADMTVDELAMRFGTTTEQLLGVVLRGIGATPRPATPHDDPEPIAAPVRVAARALRRPRARVPATSSDDDEGGAEPVLAPTIARPRPMLESPRPVVALRVLPDVHAVELPPAISPLRASLDAFEVEDDEHAAGEGAARVRARTIAMLRIRKTEIAIGRLLWPERVVRPATRGACKDGVRPCPYVGCRYNLFLDVDTERGSIKFNFPEFEPWDVPPTKSCALDIADGGGVTLDFVGHLVNLTRERVRQVELFALATVRRESQQLSDCLGETPRAASPQELL